VSAISEFVRESNRIEGIVRDPTRQELQATEEFIAADFPTVVRVKAFVAACQPNARIRDRAGLNVRVGSHIAPPGGPEIVTALEEILEFAPVYEPYVTHYQYETLHPFTDGNGRSGRAIWLWQMMRCAGGAPLGFLHHWYYQSLQGSRDSSR
jgi:hypothetical protein